MKFKILYFYILTKILNRPKMYSITLYLKRRRLAHLKKQLKAEKNYYSLNNYPPVNKSIVMENFNKVNTVSLTKGDALEIALRSEKDGSLPTKGNVTIGLSTGTSGNRGIFLATHSERARWAGIILAKLLPKSILSKQKIALFLRNNSSLYETINSNTLKFCYFSLSTEWKHNIERLQKENPEIIVAPPSILKKLAYEIKDNSFSITPLKIISAAEVLTEDDRAVIEESFKQNLHQIYQCTEGFLATSCKHGNLHLNEDFISFDRKWLNAEKTKFSPIITDTLRESLPIINYELNDILNINNSPCPCGSRFQRIESIEGRCDDIFKFENVEIYPDYIRRAIVCSANGIEEYRVTQISVDRVEIEVSPKSDEINGLILSELNLLFKTYNVENVLIVFKEYKQKDLGQKLRRVISKV